VRCVTSHLLKGRAGELDKGFMKAPLSPTLALFLAQWGLAAPAQAEPRVYELSVPAVQCAYSSEKAVKVVEDAVPISYVKADPKAHRVTVRFEDQETSLEAITTALAAKGYSVKRQKQLR
jgi:copper chaperone CopZ